MSEKENKKNEADKYRVSAKEIWERVEYLSCRKQLMLEHEMEMAAIDARRDW